MSKLLIIGAGGHGKVIADAALESGVWCDIVFLDDAWPNKVKSGIWDIHGKVNHMSQWLGVCSAAVVAIGNNQLRMELQQKLIKAGYSIATIVHPSAQVSRHAKLGAGSVVLANAVVSVDAEVGDAVIINTSATIDHECLLCKGVHIAPGVHLGGGVAVGEFSWIGIGSAVRQGVRIGSNVVIPLGSRVICDVVNSSELS